MLMLDNDVEAYAVKLEALLPAAQKAYGLRGQDTVAHRASAEYTTILKEYKANGGSLVKMAERLGVAYSGLRRRVEMTNAGPAPRRKRSTTSEEELELMMVTIVNAKNSSQEEYHAALYNAYVAGASLAKIAKKLGLSSSHPLYYGVTRHELRQKEGANA